MKKIKSVIQLRYSGLFFLSLIALALIGLSVWLRSAPVKAQTDELSPAVVVFSETFDSVTAPNLPAGWTVTNSGGSVPFATVTTFPDSAPNAVFTNDPFVTGNAALTTPPIALGNVRHKLTFRQRYQMDYEFDGGVLELSINGGAFNDIISAGGTFAVGGYNTPLVAGTLNGRNAWTGDSVNYITTEINLPANTSNQNIQLRWRFSSDNMEGGTGWWIDNVQISNGISGFNTNAISIPASGTASLYPSEINVSGQTGLVTGVQVNLNNFSHTAPDDVDLMLVAPNGNKVILMSDVGGTNAVTNLNLVFDDLAAVSLPDNSAITSGTYKPTDFETGDVFPAPAPSGAATGRMLSSFNGIQPNGAWKLFLVDDTGANAGSISGGWSISVQSSPDAIGLQNTGAADPYPSQKSVAGVLGTVTKATVTLSNFSHTAPDDVDIMLVAPNGKRIVLMSDVGGNTEVGGLNLTFDDAAAQNLPDSGTLVAGTFKPTDFETGDPFPSPAPQGATNGTTLAAFFGSAPNGVWKLFVVDDTNGNTGSIAGSWSLNLTTSTTACNFTLNPSVQAFPVAGGSGSFAINMPSNCSWSATAASNFLTLNSAANGDGNGTLAFSVAPNFGGARSGAIDVSNGVVTRTFQVQQPSGCPTSLGSTAVNFGAAGGSGNVPVTAGGVCSYLATSNANWVQITSATQSGNGTITFNVQPNTSSNARSATVTVSGQTFTVNQAATSGKRFDFDGDGKADLSVFRPSDGVWWILNSGTAASFSSIQFGIATDKIAPADYDCDRKTDFAVYRGGVWYAFQSQTNTVLIESWGIASDLPVPGDYDGDGKADLAVYRASECNWYVRRTTDSGFQVSHFGHSADKPVPADYDGDGRMDFALYFATAITSQWQILNSSNGEPTLRQFGNNGDIAVPADYDGDGRDNMAVFRPSNGTWYTSTDPATNYGARQFGANGDIPAPADFDGDGKTDVAVFRQGVWYIQNSSNDSVRTEFWGLNGDAVIPAAFTQQ
ncbi:hypothetical protein BH10ACI1_BH10ACI1_27060 [soil metagenome]